MVLAYVKGAIPEEVFSKVFQILSIASIVPLIISLLLSALITALQQLVIICSDLTGQRGVQAAGGVVGTGAVMLAYSTMDTGKIIEGMDQECEASQEDSKTDANKEKKYTPTSDKRNEIGDAKESEQS